MKDVTFKLFVFIYIFPKCIFDNKKIALENVNSRRFRKKASRLLLFRAY